jgi:hypothetical protein
VIFKKNASFNRVTFKENVSFNKVIFKKNASFWKGTFERETGFQSAFFEGEAYFDGAFLPPGKNFVLNVKKGGSISFKRTYLEGVLLKLNIDEDVLINFIDARLINTKIKKESIMGHLLQEKKEEYHQAMDVYGILETNFHSIGDYQAERWAFLKEKEMERMGYSYEYFKKENE